MGALIFTTLYLVVMACLFVGPDRYESTVQPEPDPTDDPTFQDLVQERQHLELVR